MKKKQEPIYEITPKGVMMLETNDTKLAETIMDSLELQALRRNCNALLINSEGWAWINVSKEKR